MYPLIRCEIKLQGQQISGHSRSVLNLQYRIELSKHKTRVHFNTTDRNIVGRNILRAFGHPFARCCDVLGVVGLNSKMVKFSMQHLWMHDVVVFVPVRATSFYPGMRTASLFNTQHVATRWTNVRSMLQPTMLRHVGLKCCDLEMLVISCSIS